MPLDTRMLFEPLEKSIKLLNDATKFQKFQAGLNYKQMHKECLGWKEKGSKIKRESIEMDKANEEREEEILRMKTMIECAIESQ